MRAEYLAFDLFVFGGPALLGLFAKRVTWDFVRRALLSAVTVAVPFLVWDALVAGDHWWFESQRILGWSFLGLPLEEYLFFIAVPYACLFLWEFVLWREDARIDAPKGVRVAWLAGVAITIVGIVVGAPYTMLVGLALALAVAVDDALGTALFAQRRFWWFLLCVAGLNLVFDGYLTARPVVHYSAEAITGLRVWTIPIEDFAYAVALVGGASSVFAWLGQRQPGRSWAARAIEKRFDGYRHTIRRPDTALPRTVEGRRTVAVVGGGLAGLSAASLLAERGFVVTLLERDQRLGGKLAGWREVLSDGFEADVEHGFHAFFRHYYNLSDWLEGLGIDAHLRPVGEYCVLARDGSTVRFDERADAPGLNLLRLARDGVYSLPEVAFGPAGRAMDPFLRYDPYKTFAEYDDESFAAFSERAKLPASLQLIFRTFARAFFATDEKLSLAELIKSFHFYYLSHDRGLGYDYVGGTYRELFIDPIEEHLRALDVEIRLGAGVERIEREGGRLKIDGESFDHVVLAADIRAARGILERSGPLVAEDPQLADALPDMRAGQPYVVWRVWLDAEPPDGFPVFVATERSPLLDAVTFNHDIDDVSAAWAAGNRGSVLELHCYAVHGHRSDEDVRATLLRELGRLFPEYADARVVHHHFQRRDDFTALHTGMYAARPGTRTQVDGLHLAGDWVKLPCPAMLMEAAHVSARLCVDDICAQAGVQGVLVETVPQRGLLAGGAQSVQTSTPSSDVEAGTGPDIHVCP